ncbi:MAG: hypothetical protein GY859_41980 [Desulfobacterales bacterium]|nr:hypothetical protein [Desulfobacterales bacterium]
MSNALSGADDAPEANHDRCAELTADQVNAFITFNVPPDDAPDVSAPAVQKNRPFPFSTPGFFHTPHSRVRAPLNALRAP